MQLHPQRLLVFFSLLCISINLKSQDSLVTKVVLIGTKHTPHKGYHSDSLLKIVVNLKPDVILIEQDSVSGIFKTGQFKPIPRWIQYLRRITGWSKNDVEGTMIHKFHQAFPQVIIKPHDVALNGRDRDRYGVENTKIENDFNVAMYKAYENKEMSDYRSSIHVKRRQLIDSVRHIYNSQIQEFNDEKTTDAIRQLEILDQEHLSALVDSVPSLQPFAKRVHQNQDILQLRDSIMVTQILRYIKAYPGKRIVVIAGLLHRYFQIDHLAPKQEEMNFRLLDIYAEEITFRQIVPFNPALVSTTYSFKIQTE